MRRRPATLTRAATAGEWPERATAGDTVEPPNGDGPTSATDSERRPAPLPGAWTSGQRLPSDATKSSLSMTGAGITNG